MLGQPASWQTVCRPSRATRPRISVNSGPIFALILIHGGLRSIGVSALRASMRSIRRPSGATVGGAGDSSVVTRRAYAGGAGQPQIRDGHHVSVGKATSAAVPDPALLLSARRSSQGDHMRRYVPLALVVLCLS